MICRNACTLLLVASLLVTGAAWVLSVLAFAWFTVRRLRRIPEARAAMALPLYPGWDILCVASALSLPQRILRHRERGRLAVLYAHSPTMYRYTSTRDRYLARTCYWSHMLFCAVIVVVCVRYYGN